MGEGVGGDDPGAAQVVAALGAGEGHEAECAVPARPACPPATEAPSGAHDPPHDREDGQRHGGEDDELDQSEPRRHHVGVPPSTCAGVRAGAPVVSACGSVVGGRVERRRMAHNPSTHTGAHASAAAGATHGGGRVAPLLPDMLDINPVPV